MTRTPFLAHFVSNFLKARFEEDQTDVNMGLSEQDLAKLQPFFTQTVQYCQSMLDYIAAERDLLSKLLNEPETIDQNFKRRVEDFRKNDNPWGEIRDGYIAARNGLKDIKIRVK